MREDKRTALWFFLERGGREGFARAMGVSVGTVNRWCAGIQRPGHRCAIQIEILSQGAVRREDMRPDIWGPAATATAVA